MAEAVVDGLEMVDVEQHERERGALPHRGERGAVGLRHRPAPVDQAGERVGLGKLPRFRRLSEGGHLVAL